MNSYVSTCFTNKYLGERKRQSKNPRSSSAHKQGSSNSGDVHEGNNNDAGSETRNITTVGLTIGGDVNCALEEPDSGMAFDPALVDNVPILEIEPDTSWTSNHLESLSVSTVMQGVTLLNGDNIMSPYFGDSSQQLSHGESSSSTVSQYDLPTTIDPTALLESTSSTGDRDFPFSDSYLLPVGEHTLLRAFLRVATRIGCAPNVWDLTASSPFYSPNTGSVSPSALPKHWQPTTSQLVLPHHPVLDLIPWPSVRERVINVLNLPDAARPRNATGPLAFIHFVYDMEDDREGMRVWGSDPCDPTTWEVGQALFERWWFVFDRDTIAQSNRWRQLRGAPKLSLKGPQIGAESGQSSSGSVGEL